MHTLRNPVPAPVDIEQTIDDNLDGGEFSFFQFMLPTEGMTIRLSVQQGAMALYASTDIQNPNSAFYNYMIETSGIDDVYIDPSAFGIDSSIDPAKRQSVNMFTNTTLYVSIEGLGDSNQFMMETTFGDTSMPCKNAIGFLDKVHEPTHTCSLSMQSLIMQLYSRLCKCYTCLDIMTLCTTCDSV